MTVRRKRRYLKKFLKRMQKKLIIMFLFITGILTVLIGRLMYIEYTSGGRYEKSYWRSRYMTAAASRISAEIS